MNMLENTQKTTPTADNLLTTAFDRQKQAYFDNPYPALAERCHNLQQLSRMVCEHRDEIVAAISQDFGNRADQETLFCEIIPVLDGVKHALKHLKKWMKPERRPVDMKLYLGGKNTLLPQPLGVIGIVVPWNFPLNLSLVPTIYAFAAGNRAMIKMSANSPNFTRLLKRVVPNYFSADLLQVFDDEIPGPVFTRQPFDHLIFTGSTETGRSVMKNAADNLTPVTLELGGKSPAVVAGDYPLRKAVERLLFVKYLNAGQICTTTDYLFLPEGKVDEFVALSKEVVAQRYPDIDSQDYTSIIDDDAYQRLKHTLEDAEAKGATVVQLVAGARPNDELRKLPPCLVLDPSDDMVVMQREIFGPILPIKTYREINEVVHYINSRPRPLALYPFSNDRSFVDHMIKQVISGGVTVNDCLFHVGQHDLPFGGVGASGMGHYHGYEGFVTFSKMRPIYHQAPVTALKMLMPPYGKASNRILDFMIKIAS